MATPDEPTIVWAYSRLSSLIGILTPFRVRNLVPMLLTRKGLVGNALPG